MEGGWDRQCQPGGAAEQIRAGLGTPSTGNGELIAFPAQQSSPSAAEEPVGAAVPALPEPNHCQFQKGVN